MWRVEETKQFATQVSQLKKSFPRLDDALDGVRWALTRNPTEATLIATNMKPGVNAYAVKLDPWPGVPKALVYFMVETSRVLIYAIYRTDDPGGPAF